MGEHCSLFHLRHPAVAPCDGMAPTTDRKRFRLCGNQSLGWAHKIFVQEAWEGIGNTVVLTQIVLVGTGVFALVSFPFACRHFSGKIINRISHYALIVIRTTPEYMLAYILVQLWGPSMLPAVWAILLHNGAILAFLTSNNADLVSPRTRRTQETDRPVFVRIPAARIRSVPRVSVLPVGSDDAGVRHSWNSRHIHAGILH